MDLSGRMKKTRKELKLSQADFGAKIGVSRDVINNIELNRLNTLPNDILLKHICNTFNINYSWLVDGVGEQFVDFQGDILADFARKYDLDEEDVIIVESYAKLPPNEREAIKALFIEFAKKIKR